MARRESLYILHNFPTTDELETIVKSIIFIWININGICIKRCDRGIRVWITIISMWKVYCGFTGKILQLILYLL